MGKKQDRKYGILRVNDLAEGVWLIQRNGSAKIAEPVIDMNELESQSNINFMQLAKDVRNDLASYLALRGSGEMWGTLTVTEDFVQHTPPKASSAALDILTFISLSPEARRRELDRLVEVVELHESHFDGSNSVLRNRVGKLIASWNDPKTIAAQIKEHQDLADKYRRKFEERTGVAYTDES